MKRLAKIACPILMCCGSMFAGTISLQPSSATLILGSPLTLNVNVSGIIDLCAFQFDIAFNPAILSATSVTEGALFSGIGVVFSPGSINNTAGTITNIGDFLSGPGVGTDGTLATINFNSIGAGSSSLTLSNVVLLNSSGGNITATVSGTSVSVTDEGPAVPEPATFVLCFPVLVVIGLRIRSRSAQTP